MTDATTPSTQNAGQNFSGANRTSSDAAPMVITRLSGWIDVSELKAEARGWIVPTRVQHTAR